MASLSITAANVRIIDDKGKGNQLSVPAGATLTAGMLVKQDGTTGHWIKSGGDDAATFGNRRFILLKGGPQYRTITAVNDCLVDLGQSVLDAASIGDPVYASDTDGELTLTVGESTLAAAGIIGYVTGFYVGSTLQKVLYVNGS